MKQSAEVVPYPVPKVKNKKYIWPLLGFQNAYFFLPIFFNALLVTTFKNLNSYHFPCRME